MSLEGSTADSGSLLEDLHLVFSAPLRLVATALEVHGWELSARTVPAVQMLRSMVFSVPDSKLIEDVHQRLRNAQKARPNDRMTPACVQQICNHCNVLDSRKIRHGPVITRKGFFGKPSRNKSPFPASQAWQTAQSQTSCETWSHHEEPNLACSHRTSFG